MAYNASFPADDSYLSDFPAGDREQTRALKDDQIVNAGKLQGLTIGNKNGQIPINNGTENANLNAALLNGKASSYFATSNHSHTTATQSSNGYMSNADKKKLDGIASGAEVNQNAFANVKVGTTTIQADAKQDTLTLAAGANIALTPDGNNDKVTIGVTGKVASATTADKVNGNASDGGVVNLVTGTMAANDGFRIRVGGTNNSGYAEIATKDDGSEPIYVRQYTGDFATITRTATILDGSGNTSFPGRVTANGGCSLGGSLNLANKTLNLAGDDCYFGDQDIAGGFCLKGASGTTNLTLINKDNTTQKASLSYAGGNLISSATIQGNLSGTATNANNLVISGTSAHIKYGGGDVDENTAISQNKVNLLIGSWYSTGFRDLCSSGTPIRVAINHRNGNIKTTGAVTASGGFRGNLTGNATSATKATQDKNGLQIDTNYLKRSGGTITGQLTMGTGTEVQIKAPNNTGFYFNSGALGCYNWSGTNGGSIFSYSPSSNTFAFGKAVTAPTPGTSDNGTRVATTAFVHSLVDTKNDVYIGAGTGSVKNTSFTIPLPSGYSRGQCKYAIFPTSHTIDTNSGWYTLNVNQGTGVVSGAISYDKTGGGSLYSQISFGYVVIAVK